MSAAAALIGTPVDQERYLAANGWANTIDGWRDPVLGGNLLREQAVRRQAKRHVEAARSPSHLTP